MSASTSSYPDAYSHFEAELAEVLKHKYLESEKADEDIGFEKALTDWAGKHRAKWRQSQQPGKK
jgi:hypothetical protein